MPVFLSGWTYSRYTGIRELLLSPRPSSQRALGERLSRAEPVHRAVLEQTSGDVQYDVCFQRTEAERGQARQLHHEP